MPETENTALRRYEVEIRETFVYRVPVEAVNEAAAGNVAFSFEWVNANDEVTVVHQNATLVKVEEVP